MTVPTWTWPDWTYPSCYDTLIPRHDYQPTDQGGVYVCSRCRRAISVEVVPIPTTEGR